MSTGNLQMRYKNFTFPIVPKSITVATRRNITTHFSPFDGAIIQDNGIIPRIISGNGVFHGSEAVSQFNRLRQAFLSSGYGNLQLPFGETIIAIFTSLKMIGEAGPDIIRYAFEFSEVEPDNYFE